MTAVRGREIAGTPSAWIERREAQRRRSYLVFVAVMVVAGVLALLSDFFMYAPLVAAFLYAAVEGFAWLRWWRWRDRTDDTGQVLVPASVPRSTVARDTAIIFPHVLIRGVLVAGDGAWEWRPPGLTRHEFRSLRWHESEIVAVVPRRLWGPGSPATASLRLHLTHDRLLVMETQLDRRLAAVTQPVTR
jgi:hypothetical protein